MIISLLMLLASGSSVFSFGTISYLGQNSEHERITRRAYANPASPSSRLFVQPRTLDLLAGRSGTFGAVGYPDDLSNGMNLISQAHCDDGDFLPTPGYPQSRTAARGHITKCIGWMNKYFRLAVATAAAIVDQNLRINAAETDISDPDCVTRNNAGLSAKCRVLTNFGIMLHTAQDFYSHSNWVDIANSSAPVSPTNPPGLGKLIPAPFLAMPQNTIPLAKGLMTGCFEALPESYFCEYSVTTNSTSNTLDRVKHAYLNKDQGTVDPSGNDPYIALTTAGIVGEGTTPRGRINRNFERAVSVAILDSINKLRDLRKALNRSYGATRGEKIFCAITHDDPLADCPTITRHLLITTNPARFVADHDISVLINGHTAAIRSLTAATRTISVNIPETVKDVTSVEIVYPSRNYPGPRDPETLAPAYFRSVELVEPAEDTPVAFEAGDFGDREPGTARTVMDSTIWYPRASGLFPGEEDGTDPLALPNYELESSVLAPLPAPQPLPVAPQPNLDLPTYPLPSND